MPSLYGNHLLHRLVAATADTDGKETGKTQNYFANYLHETQRVGTRLPLRALALPPGMRVASVSGL